MDFRARTIDAAKKYVMSSTLDRVDCNAELVRGDLGKAVQQLKPESGEGLFRAGREDPGGVSFATICENPFRATFGRQMPSAAQTPVSPFSRKPLWPIRWNSMANSSAAYCKRQAEAQPIAGYLAQSAAVSGRRTGFGSEAGLSRARS